MPATHTIVITDDHPLMISGMKAILTEQHHLRVVYTATSGEELIHWLKTGVADLLILDISMPRMDGLQTATEIRKRYPDQKILCISTFYERQLYQRLEAIPVQGFLPKLTDTSLILDTINKVLAGERIYIKRIDQNPVTTKVMLSEIRNSLSRRELEILTHIKAGKTTKDIADALYVSIATIDTHRKNISRKLHLDGANALYKFAVENM